MAAAGFKEHEDGGGAVAVEAQPEITVVGGKSKKIKTGNLIFDVAHEVESLSKTKAINEAGRLAEDIELNYFKLGGVLKLILDNSWFEGFSSFEHMVFESFGFQGRKARYLITIYDNLVTKQIPWEVVSHLGWTKVKDLAPVLTLDNVEEWVKKAENVTVAQLQAMLKASLVPSGDGEKTVKTSDDTIKRIFKLKPDQNDACDQALAKAKAELHTEYDNVAFENICQWYCGTSVPQSSTAISLDEQIQQTGFHETLLRIVALFPEYDITVDSAKQPTGETDEDGVDVAA